MSPIRRRVFARRGQIAIGLEIDDRSTNFFVGRALMHPSVLLGLPLAVVHDKDVIPSDFAEAKNRAIPSNPGDLSGDRKKR